MRRTLWTVAIVVSCAFHASAQTLPPVTIESYTPPPVVYAPPPPPAMPVPRFEARIGYENTFVNANTGFNTAAALWGYNGFDNVPAVSVEGAWLANRWFRIGGRFAYAWGTAGQAYYDGAELDAACESLGVFVGARTPTPRTLRRVYVDFGGRVEADAVLGQTSLRGESQTSGGGRFAARLEFGLIFRPVVIDLYAGYQWLEFGSGGPTPISFEGPYVGLSAGVRL